MMARQESMYGVLFYLRASVFGLSLDMPYIICALTCWIDR